MPDDDDAPPLTGCLGSPGGGPTGIPGPREDPAPEGPGDGRREAGAPSAGSSALRLERSKPSSISMACRQDSDLNDTDGSQVAECLDDAGPPREAADPRALPATRATLAAVNAAGALAAAGLCHSSDPRASAPAEPALTRRGSSCRGTTSVLEVAADLAVEVSDEIS